MSLTRIAQDLQLHCTSSFSFPRILFFFKKKFSLPSFLTGKTKNLFLIHCTPTEFINGDFLGAKPKVSQQKQNFSEIGQQSFFFGRRFYFLLYPSRGINAECGIFKKQNCQVVVFTLWQTFVKLWQIDGGCSVFDADISLAL